MGRDPVRNEKARDERREAILRASLRRFATAGYGATKVSDIARAAGISQGLLYHYFPSKDAVYVTLVREAFGRLAEAVRSLEAMEATPRQKLEVALRELLAEVQRHERFAHNILLLAEAGLSDGVPAEARAVVERSREEPYRVVAGILRAGQADGSVRPGDPADQAVLFWSMIRGLALSRATRGRVFERSGAELLERVFLTETTGDER